MTSWPGYEVLSYDNLEQRQKWRAICQSFREIDIYFYPEYVYLFELNGDGKATCFVYYESADDLVIYPFLRRSINELSIFRDIPNNLIDITTPYGYGGYLRSSAQVNMERFYSEFSIYCQQNNIVSEFIRFHPILRNYSYAPITTKMQLWNDTVIIDLAMDNNTLWNNITSICRNKIRKAIKSNITIVEDEYFNDIDTFYNLYCETMRRLGASDYYYFSKPWFDDMVSLLKDHMVLFHALYQNKIIMSGIFLIGDTIAHYFLSGSIYEMRHLPANNLLLYEAALWAKKRGLKYLHLGGGYQGNDSLFKFKASFSPLRAPFYIGSVIHNSELNQYLNKIRCKLESERPVEGDFFPVYRTPFQREITITDLKNTIIKEHYRKEAEKHGDSRSSTMEDLVVREKEVEFIIRYFSILKNIKSNIKLRVLDLGCGNGYMLSVLSIAHKNNSYIGIDLSHDLLSIANKRCVPNCKFIEGNATSIPLEDNCLDVVFTERCLINILNWEEQKLALSEIRRILKPSGYYLMIECFTDGLINKNKARKECGLSELEEAYHNKYFDKDFFFQFIKGKFRVIESDRFGSDENGHVLHSNFLSSHYFIARVLHPLVTKGDWVRNTEFVNFFSFLPPIGNYSPIQAYILQKEE